MYGLSGISSRTHCDIKGKKYIDTPQKLCFSDVGLHNARLNSRQIGENHTMENILFNELVNRGFNVDVGLVITRNCDESSNQQQEQREVDFACNKKQTSIFSG